MTPLRLHRRFCIAHRRGTVLVIVLWITLGLVSVSLYFANSSRLNYLASDNVLAGERSEQAILGAERYMCYTLETLAQPGVMPDVDNDDYEAEEVPVAEARFWMIGRDENSDTTPSEPVFGLVDEASKLNINTATPEMIEALPGMTTELAAAIVDWRDEDDDVSAEGAESQDYQLLDNPYDAKNSAFETPEEIRLLNGADNEILYGEDANRNGVLDSNEDDGDASWPPDDADGQLDPGVLEYITTFTREPNTQSDGSPRAMLTDAAALRTQLTETLGTGRAEEIMTLVEPTLPTMESVLEFYIASNMSKDELAQLEDKVTVQSGDYRVGLVNVNTAPWQVIACLPGMTEEIARNLVSSRQSVDSDSRRSIAWLKDVLDPDTAKLAGPHITARSYQYSMDVVALAQGARGFRRAFVVYDYESEPKIIYRRDTTRMGNPFTREERSEISQRMIAGK